MMTWPIAILPNCNDCPWLFKRAIHCPSEDQCNRLLFLCFVCFVVVFRLFDCFVFSLDVCCRCTVLFLYAYTCVSYNIIILITFFLSQ